MKKTLLLLSLLTGTFLSNAQNVVFENNFDNDLDNLSIFDLDGDGDNGLGWYGVPGSFPTEFSGGFIELNGEEASGLYQNGTFDYNTFETKDPVTIPSGGTAALTFDLLVDGPTGSSFSTEIIITVYDNNTAYNVIGQFAQTVDFGFQYAINIDLSSLSLGQSYIYEVAQFDDPRVQSAFLIDNFKITHTPALSSEDFSSTTFSLYPNPASDVLNISSELVNISSISISDINGRTVKNIEFNQTNAQVNVSDLNAGVYMVTISSEEGSTVKKFVKK